MERPYLQNIVILLYENCVSITIYIPRYFVGHLIFTKRVSSTFSMLS